MPDSNSSDELAIKLLQESFSEIDPSRRDYDYFPNIVEDFVDVSKVCIARRRLMNTRESADKDRYMDQTMRNWVH